MAGHARAVDGEGTTGKDESDGDGFTFVIAETHGFAEFVGEFVFGQQVPNLQRLHFAHAAEGGRGVGGGHGADFFDLIDPAIVFGDDHAEGDLVVGGKAGEFVAVLHIEHHGHRFHVARNVFVLDLGLHAVRGNLLDHAFDLKGFALTGNGEDGQNEDNNETVHVTY